MTLHVSNGPEPTGIMELLTKLQQTDNYFVLLFKGWNTNADGEQYADIELVVNGFRDSDTATLNDLGDFIVQIGNQM